MKNLYIIVSIIFIAVSCKKDSPKLYTIKGQLLNCSNGITVPTFTNTTIDLFQLNNGSNNKSKVIASTTTDNQGNFTFSYYTNNKYDKLIIRTSSGFGFFKIMEGIPLKAIDNLKVILPAYNLVVGLNVSKAYTSSDTLFYGKPVIANDFKLAGPFSTGRLFKSTNILFLNTLSYSDNEQFVSYRINNPFGAFNRKMFIIENSKLCGDTVYVNIDVK